MPYDADIFKIPFGVVFRLVADRIAKNDRAHDKRHITEVYKAVRELSQTLGWAVNMDALLLATCYHDVHRHIDNANHHVLGAKAIDDETAILTKLGYTEEDLAIAKICCLEHRSGFKGPYTNKESELFAAADKGLLFRDVDRMLERAIQYREDVFKVPKKEAVEDAYRHLRAKFGREKFKPKLNPIIYELYQEEWEAMWDMMNQPPWV